ncbi:MAG TPA: hypothetical protein VFB62_01155, partial [Polyangiaceae bacterium]|nr:hypothetical protein [Polyangiaceae bacterium]
MRALWLCALTACAPVSEYPAGPYAIELGATLPDLHFAGVDETGVPTEIALHDFYAPETGGLLTVMVSG